MKARWALVSISVAAATLIVACGGNANQAPGSEASGDGGESPGSAGISGSAGTAVAGSGGSDGTAASSSSGGTAVGGSGGSPELDRFGLIMGDDACPSTAPMTASCGEVPISCVYRGVQTLTWSFGTSSCVCLEGSWRCVSSDTNGDTRCPPTQPKPEDTCAPGGQHCDYANPGAFGVSCYCVDGGSWGCGA